MLDRRRVLVGMGIFLTIINVMSCYRSNKVVVSPDKAYTQFLAALENDSKELLDLVKKYENAKAKLFDAMLEDLVRQSKDDTPDVEQLQEEKRLIVEQLKRSEKLISFYKKRFSDLLEKIRTYRS